MYKNLVAAWLEPWIPKAADGVEGPESARPVSPILWLAIQEASSPSCTILKLVIFHIWLPAPSSQEEEKTKWERAKTWRSKGFPVATQRRSTLQNQSYPSAKPQVFLATLPFYFCSSWNHPINNGYCVSYFFSSVVENHISSWLHPLYYVGDLSLWDCLKNLWRERERKGANNGRILAGSSQYCLQLWSL